MGEALRGGEAFKVPAVAPDGFLRLECIRSAGYIIGPGGDPEAHVALSAELIRLVERGPDECGQDERAPVTGACRDERAYAMWARGRPDRMGLTPVSIDPERLEEDDAPDASPVVSPVASRAAALETALAESDPSGPADPPEAEEEAGADDAGEADPPGARPLKYGPSDEARPPVTQRFKVLKALARRAGAGWAEVTNPRIAEDAGLRSAASVAAYLSSLDRDGLIERQGFSRERRIRVTEKGRAALGEASAGPAEPQGPEAAPEPTPEPAPEPPPEPAGPSGAPDTARYSRGPSEGARLIRAKRAHPPAPFRVPPIGTGPGRPVDGDLDETRRIVLEAIDELREAGRDAGEGDRPGLYRLDRESATPRQLVNAANGLRFKRGEPALALPDPDPVTNRRGASSLAGF